MLSMEEFALYSPFDQPMCICDHGVCLHGKLEGYYEVYLYSVANLFVEFRYDALNKRVDLMAIFKEGPCLECYLADITLPAVL